MVILVGVMDRQRINHGNPAPINFEEDGTGNCLVKVHTGNADPPKNERDFDKRSTGANWTIRWMFSEGMVMKNQIGRRGFWGCLGLFAGYALRPPRAFADADITLRVELPSDRTRVGRLAVYDGSGTLLAGPWPVLGKADGQTAAHYHNPTRSTILQYGDTPTGTYKVTGAFKVGDRTNYSAHSYGINGALKLSPVDGDAKQASDIGQRTGLLIHAGDLNDSQKLRPTNGCLRLSNDDMKSLMDELLAAAIINNSITATCSVQSVAVQVTDPTAAPDEGYDEGDPPPLDPTSSTIP